MIYKNWTINKAGGSWVAYDNTGIAIALDNNLRKLKRKLRMILSYYRSN